MSRTFTFALLIVFISSPITITPVRAATTDIVINEIGASENSDHEWFEIYNKGTAPVDMTGWKFFEADTNHGLSAFQGDMTIEPGEYAIIADVAANTAADYPSFTGTIIDSAWTTLTEAGESIALKDNTGAFIEQFAYIAAPTHSLERVDATKTDYTATNWKEHASGNTIGTINAASAPISPPIVVDPPPADPPPVVVPPTTPPAVPAQPQATYYARGDMYINEFVSDPTDDDVEWIELYNPQIKDIDLTGWSIEDGSNTKTNLSGKIGSSANNRFFIVENPKGKLNNAGDLIILKDPNGITVDDVSFGNWDDGNTLNNAPKAADPSSTARLKDGHNSYNNAFDFQVTTKPTKGSSNVIIDPAIPADDATAPFIKDIIISELLPDPIGVDSKTEFIELYNKGDKDIDLLGWEIVNAAGRKYIVDNKKLKDTTIKAKSYFIFERPVTGLALKNTGGDSVTLYQPNGEKPNATLAYKEKTIQGHSYAFFSDQENGWTTTPTPGVANIKTLANEPPDPDMEMPNSGAILEELMFDASDTTDAEQDPLTYHWDFGDGQQGDSVQLSHHYSTAGRYKVSLTVKDPTNEKKATKTIVIEAASQTVSPQPMSKLPPEEIPQSIAGISPVVINEIAPNPKGKDTNEFIELTNISNVFIDVSGWRVTYQLGKKSYTFPAGSRIDPGALLVLTPTANKIQLRNAADTVTLYNSQGDFMDVVSYEDAPEAQSLMRTKEGDFVWSTSVTSGKQNSSNASPMSDIELSGPQSTLSKSNTVTASSKTTASKATSKKSTPDIIQTTLAQARDLPLDTSVSVKGVVSSTPGSLGANIFYLAGSGMQIYVSKNQMPKLLIGDTVQLTGVRSQISDEARIKVGKDNTIRFISHGPPPIAHPISITDVGEEYEGSLVTIKGEVVKTQWPSIYIDDGTDEARVYVKTSTGITRMKIDKASTLQATGIVSQTSTGYRILPRTKDDLILTTTNIANPQTPSTPQKNDNSTLTLTASDKPIPLIQIGVVSLFSIVFLASSMYIRRRSPKK